MAGVELNYLIFSNLPVDYFVFFTYTIISPTNNKFVSYLFSGFVAAISSVSIAKFRCLSGVFVCFDGREEL